jgi:proteic killer suppression protein
MISSFGDRTTESLSRGGQGRDVRRYPVGILRSALRKLDMLDAAATLGDLRALPGNRLEVLRGDLEGLHSVRVNRQ